MLAWTLKKDVRAIKFVSDDLWADREFVLRLVAQHLPMEKAPTKFGFQTARDTFSEHHSFKKSASS